MCVSFYYHMYGPYVGNLTVYAVEGSSNTELWNKDRADLSFAVVEPGLTVYGK